MNLFGRTLICFLFERLEAYLEIHF